MCEFINKIADNNQDNKINDNARRSDHVPSNWNNDGDKMCDVHSQPEAVPFLLHFNLVNWKEEVEKKKRPSFVMRSRISNDQFNVSYFDRSFSVLEKKKTQSIS